MSALSPEDALIQALLAAPGSRARLGFHARELDWDLLTARLRAQGLSPLLLRHDLARRLSIPQSVRRRLQDATDRSAGEARRCQFTLYRFLAAAERQGLETALLKGAALVGSVYDDPSVRHMADIDILVRPAQVQLARRVGEEIGVGLGPGQLPVFFHRLVNFAMAFRPHLPGMVPIDLHWRLHSPALLLTDRIERVWERCERVRVYGYPTRVLDAADLWLHLATHLWSQWGETPTALEPDDLGALIGDGDRPVDLKWVLDLVTTCEKLPDRINGARLAERAHEWCAVRETAATLLLLRPLLSPGALRFADETLARLQAAYGPRPLVARGAPLRASRQAGETAHPLLGFRPRTLRRLVPWVFPPNRYLRAAAGVQRSGVAGAVALLGARAAHTTRVLARAALAALALPAALVASAVATAARERRRQAARPARVFALLQQLAEFENAYRSRFGAGSPGPRDPVGAPARAQRGSLARRGC